MKILIAEDSNVTRKLLENNLSQWGHTVVESCDGQEALAKLKDNLSIHLAILDWEMPKMDGIDVCREIKQLAGHPFVYVIMLTAKTETEDVVAALYAGADDYICKPFDNSELESRIRAGERIVGLEQAMQDKIHDLESALEQVRQLQGFVPICAWCKNVRDDSNYWQSVENYITKNSEAEVSHSICPECLEKHYGEYTLEKSK